MIHNASKRGRPTGTSQFPEDRVALERMHLLCEHGMTAYKAAEKVVEEMALSEVNKKQAIDRLRKKYPKFCEENRAAAKKEEGLRYATPTPQLTQVPSPQDWERFREHQEYLETPAGRFVKEHLIRLTSDENYRKQLREALDAYRLVTKLTG